MVKKILLTIIIAPLSIFTVFGQDFYDSTRIQEVRLYFSQPNWRTLLNTAAASTTEPYTLARKVVINGVSFDSVGAKFKGNSTFKATNKKNPFHIELDNVKDQNYQGYKDIKLANVSFDPSFVREALSYELMQPYTNLPRANFAKVWVNDTLQGLYTNTEAVTKTFCKKNFYSTSGNVFVKCTPSNLMGGTGGASSLVYFSDSTKYYSGYEINSNYGWKQLSDLCDTLNNKSSDIEKILDVDRALWMLAFNALFVNLDSYTGRFTQNYYLWRDDNARFNAIIWDLNMSFGAFQVGGGQPGPTTDTLAMARFNIFSEETNVAKPLISKLFANPRFKKMYVAHIRTMAKELFKSGKYLTRALQMQQLIDVAVQEDVNKSTTYAAFKSNLYYNLVGSGAGFGGTPGIFSLMESRMKYLDTLAATNFPTPVLTNLTTTNNPKINDSVWVSVKVMNNASNGVLIGYRSKTTDYFTRTELFDDGLHKDGAANDGVFGIGFILKNPTIEFYIWAENGNAGVFSPERSEHEYHKISVGISASDVVINELMATNTKTQADPKGQFDDWVELYNKSKTAVDISGWFISDTPDKRGKWQFPQGTKIPAEGYLIVWADEDSSQNTATSLHANFKLSGSGEQVLLSQKDTTLLDQITFGVQSADISFARRPNGTGNFVLLTPTFNANNNTGTNATEDILLENDVKVFPNPANTEGVTVLLNTDKKLDLSVFNALGQLIFQDKIFQEYQIKTHDWQQGLYFIRVGNVCKKIVIGY
jgi:CotH kinase protein/Lamin Tail Domain/Secretion system C-terminal sorting domain